MVSVDRMLWVYSRPACTCLTEESERVETSSVETVVLVDADGREIGRVEKLEAHRQGLLHRAFSVFILNDGGQLLLQRRSRNKYHSGGLWTNTCCSHPRPAEEVIPAARRRLREEMGIDAELTAHFTFIYEARLDSGLTEHELDHVLVGRYQGDPSPDPAEVEGWWWVGLAEVEEDIERRPEAYTIWFKLALPKLLTLLRAES